MDKDKIIEDLEFENKLLKCENEYIKKNLKGLRDRQTVTEAEASSRIIRLMIKLRRRLNRR